MKEPEYILYRREHLGLGGVLSRVAFPEAKSTLKLVIRQVADLSLCSNFLEIGCGTGAGMMYLANHVSMGMIIGIDIDRAAVSEAFGAAKFLHLSNFHYIVASGSHLPIRDATIDFVLCQEVIEHVISPLLLLGETKRTLKNKGKFLLTTPVTCVAPFSSDWVEIKLRGRPIIDEFAFHKHRFESDLLVGLMKKSGFDTCLVKFTNQYVGSFLLFLVTLWKRRKFRLGKSVSGTCNSAGNRSILPNAIFMIGQTLDFSLFGYLPFGSNIMVLSLKQR